MQLLFLPAGDARCHLLPEEPRVAQTRNLRYGLLLCELKGNFLEYVAIRLVLATTSCMGVHAMMLLHNLPSFF